MSPCVVPSNVSLSADKLMVPLHETLGPKPFLESSESEDNIVAQHEGCNMTALTAASTCADLSEKGYLSDSDSASLSSAFSVSVEKELPSIRNDTPHLVEQDISETNTRDASTTLSPMSKKPSILKPFDVREIPIKSKRRSWNALPPPSCTMTCRNTTSTATLPVATKQRQRQQEESPPSQRHVSFHVIQIRHYEQTLGDNPAVSYGPPISLDWTYHDDEPNIAIDTYEYNHPRRRTHQQLVLSHYQRVHQLKCVCGFSDAALIEAQRAAERIRRQRERTRFWLACGRVEEMLETLHQKREKSNVHAI